METQSHAVNPAVAGKDRFATRELGETLVRGFSEKIKVYTAEKSVTAEVHR